MKDETWTDDTPVPTPRDAAPAVELGRGGLGRVLLVHDPDLRRDVARKELLRDGSAHRARFLREARITAQLEHPSIVPVYALGDDPERPSYTMRLIRGETLGARVRAAADAAARRRLLPHVVDACQAVAYAHARGVVHRDLKPENIMVGAFGETLVVDWGLARVVGEPDDAEGVDTGDAAQTRIGAVMGSPAYMSPEQARGEPADARSDVWSLGVVLFEVLSGRRPFPGAGSDEVLAGLREGRFEDLDRVLGDVAPDLVAVVAKAVRPAPADRYPDAASMARDLEAWQSGQLVEAYRYSLAERAVRLVVRHWLASSVAVVALAVLAVAGVLFVVGLRRERDAALAARTRAELEAADARVSLARTRADLGDVGAADELREAEAALVAHGGSLARVEVVRAWLRYRIPPPTLVTETAPKMSRSGRRLLVGQRDRWDLVDAVTGRRLAQLGGPGTLSAEFVGEDPWLFVSTDAGTELRDAAGTTRVPVGPGPVLGAWGHPDGFWIWRLGHGAARIDREGRTLLDLGQAAMLHGVSTDGRRILGAQVGDTVHRQPDALVVWDDQGRVVSTLPGGHQGVLSPSGRRAASLGRTVVVVGEGGERWEHDDPSIVSVGFLGDDVLVGTRNDGGFVRWRASDGEVLGRGHLPGIVVGASSTEDVVVLLQGERYAVHAGRPLDRRLPRTRPQPIALRALPDGETFVVVGWSGAAEVVDRVTGRVLRTFAVCPSGVRDVDVDASGRWIVTADRCGRVRTWDLAGGDGPVLDVAGEGIATVAAWLDDGGRIGAAFADGTWREWDRDGRPVARLALGLVPWGAVVTGPRLVVSGRNEDDPVWAVFDRASGRRTAVGQDGVGYGVVSVGPRVVISTQEGPLVWVDPEDGATFTTPVPLSPDLASSGDRLAALSHTGDVVLLRGAERIDTLPLHREVPGASVGFVGNDLVTLDAGGSVRRLSLGPPLPDRTVLAHDLLGQGMGTLALELLEDGASDASPLDRVRALAVGGQPAAALAALAALEPGPGGEGTVAAWRRSLGAE